MKSRIIPITLFLLLPFLSFAQDKSSIAEDNQNNLPFSFEGIEDLLTENTYLLDSNISNYYHDDGTAYIRSKAIYEYDDQERRILSKFVWWDATEETTYVGRVVLTEYLDSMEIIIEKGADNALSPLINNTRKTYYYDNAGNEKKYTEEKWDEPNQQWVNYSQYTSEQVSSTLTVKTKYNWNVDIEEYELAGKDEITTTEYSEEFIHSYWQDETFKLNYKYLREWNEDNGVKSYSSFSNYQSDTESWHIRFDEKITFDLANRTGTMIIRDRATASANGDLIAHDSSSMSYNMDWNLVEHFSHKRTKATDPFLLYFRSQRTFNEGAQVLLHKRDLCEDEEWKPYFFVDYYYSVISDTEEIIPPFPIELLFPNPANQSSSIWIRTNSEKSDPFELQIVNVQGQRMAYQKVRGNDQIHLSTLGLPPGFYFINLWNKDSGLKSWKMFMAE